MQCFIKNGALHIYTSFYWYRCDVMDRFGRYSFALLIRTLILFTFPLLLSSCIKAVPKNIYNFDFEQKDVTGNPLGWKCTSRGLPTNDVGLDSVTKFEGHYSLLLNASLSGAASVQCKYIIPANFRGKKIELSAFIKSGNRIKNAGLYLRLEDINKNILGQIETDTLGNADWKRYTVQLPYDAQKTAYIVLGAYVKDTGKAWVDHFQVLIDGVPIEKLQPSRPYPAQRDTFFNNGTTISLEGADGFQIENLKVMGVVWGFLKYHHPEIKKGNVNWDAVLFRTLPQYLNVHDIEARNTVLEKMVFSLDSNNTIDKLQVLYKPHDGINEKQFDKLHLSPKLISHLKAIEQASVSTPTSYYANAVPQVNNPLFPHEIQYGYNPYPDVGVRILALYRFWNMIKYFYVNKGIIGRDWDDVLGEFLPQFIIAKDQESYALVCLQLIGSIHDTHAGVYGNPILEKIKGLYMAPFQAKFIENKLVVTGYYIDDAHVKKLFSVGDIIETINGIAIDSLVKRYAPYTPASNFSTMLRDLSSAYGFLLRSSDKKMTVRVFNGLERKSISIATVPIARIDPVIDFQDPKNNRGFRFLDNTKILNIFPALLKEQDVDSIRLLAQRATGILIDFRCYPATFMPFTYGAWLKPHKSPFVLISKIDSLRPGHIRMRDTIYNGSDTIKNFKAKRVAILVDERTQSSAEYTVMALQTAPLAKVIGSTTAGADGNVSYIALPGGIETYISGIGIFYPNGLNTQRAGVKIDISVSPTIKGIRTGKDEILERGIKYIKEGK